MIAGSKKCVNEIKLKIKMKWWKFDEIDKMNGARILPIVWISMMRGRPQESCLKTEIYACESWTECLSLTVT
jgi:hypothetical protein